MIGEYVALSGVFVTLILAILQFLWNSNVKAAEIDQYPANTQKPRAEVGLHQFGSEAQVWEKC